MSILDDLKEYFKNTPREQVIKDWEDSKEKAPKGSPTIKQFIKMKKIQDLELYEAVELNNDKFAKKYLKKIGMIGRCSFVGYICIRPSKDDYEWVLEIKDFKWPIKKIYKASDFFPKKKKWKSEIARLDSEVNELRHMLAKDITEDVKLEVGKWYNVYLIGQQSQRALICIESINDIEVHFFGFRLGEWVEKDWINICHTYKPATPEEVKSALIKEAERRGYKDGVTIKDLHTETECVIINMTWHTISADLRTNIESKPSYCIYHNGKWAEIVKQPKEIDWSVPGQLVVNEKGYVWLTTGEHDENNFKGVYIKHGKDNAFEIGMVSCGCVKSAFKPYTGEPIILKP